MNLDKNVKSVIKEALLDPWVALLGCKVIRNPYNGEWTYFLTGNLPGHFENGEFKRWYDEYLFVDITPQEAQAVQESLKIDWDSVPDDSDLWDNYVDIKQKIDYIYGKIQWI